MGAVESKGYIGQSVPRFEDQRLLRGEGQYIADMVLPGMLHVAFVRSPVAHARIRGVDLSRARALPGVRLAMSGAEVQAELPPVQGTQLALPSKWKTIVPHQIFQPNQPLLATDKVLHVGEAIAVIVADSRYIAEDALELVDLDLEELPAVVDAEKGLAPGAPLLHEKNGSNLLARFEVNKGDVKAALAAAPRKVSRRFFHHRYAAMPMECRGVIAQYERRTDSYTVWSATQVVHWVRREAAQTLGVPEARVRCIAPDVGGGFGGKGHVYPEDLLMPFLAKRVGKPVKWVEDRREHLQAACHSRDQVHEVEVGYDNDGRILAVRDHFTMDCGAWNPIGVGIPYNTASHLAGPYKIPNLFIEAKIVATNKVPNAPYRGAGRPEAALATERIMDVIALELGLEPAEVRRRNMVQASEMPYSAGFPYRDGMPVVYDSGDYPGALEKVLASLGGLEAFRKRQAEARKQGRYLGIGIGCYTEGTGVGPFEGATVRLDPSGKLYMTGGACPQGQGMETIFAQIVADQWKVKPQDVVVVLGDSSAIQMGFGTIASRSTVNMSGAIHMASERLRARIFAVAGNAMECAPEDLELRDGRVSIVGVPDKSMTLAEISRAARPGWDNLRPAGIDAGLEETYYWEPPTVTWSYAAHAAIVEVDAAVGKITVEKYAVAHDCGVVVNPMLAEGQIIGGAVQGLGGALLEEFHYDDQGQLQTGSFMDYLLPTASDVPRIDVTHVETPSPLNPLGVKGLGEGGAISPPVVIANAVGDALAPFGRIEFNSTPVRPEQVFAVVKGSPAGRAAA